MKVAVIGTGFVGVVTAAVFASFGNDVVGLDIDPEKIKKLTQSSVPFYEPGLEELLQEQQKTGRLTFTTAYEEAIPEAEVVFVAVGTPSQADGTADLRFVNAACDQLAEYLSPGAVIVVKSTVPPGTLPAVHARIASKTTTTFYTASVPEFLKEGTAVYDTLHPDRIVIGAREDAAYERLAELHAPLKAPIIRVSPESAQMGKYAANSYLALRITFINQIADLCTHNGADVQEVIRVIGEDARIGPHYWYPGFGYGGSCFPKDVKEIAQYSKQVGEGDNLFVKLNELNDRRMPKLLTAYGDAVGGWKDKRVTVLGLSFKPNTDDIREAPSLTVIPWLLEHGAHVVAYDPKAMEIAARALPEHSQLEFAPDIDAAVADSDAVLALIEWKEIVEFDFAAAKQDNKKQYFIDARNQYNPQDLTSAGYSYIGVGRQVPTRKKDLA